MRPYTDREDFYVGNVTRHNEVDYEKAAILYNIGATYSFLGSSDNRSTADGKPTDRVILAISPSI